MATITVEERPAQLVIDLGVTGADAVHASYREVLLNEDGSVRSFEHTRTVTLKELGDEFPWSDFIEPVVFKALREAEDAKQLRVDLTQAQEALKASVEEKDSEIAILRNTIADRDRLLSNIFTGIQNLQNGVASELQARMPKDT